MVTIKPLNKNKEEIELKPEPVVEKKETTVKSENTTAKTDSKKEVLSSLKDNVKNKATRKIETVDPNTLIPCRSLTTGTLVWENGYIWHDYNSVIEIPMHELTRMRGKNPKFLTDMLMIVEDEKAFKELRLEQLYEEAVHIENLSEIFSLSLEDLEYVLNVLPKNLHDGIKMEAHKAIKNDMLSDIKKVKLIEEKLKLGDSLRLYLDIF